MVLSYGNGSVKVGDGSSYFEDAVVGAGAHVHLGDGLAEFFHSFGVGFGEFVQYMLPFFLAITLNFV